MIWPQCQGYKNRDTLWVYKRYQAHELTPYPSTGINVVNKIKQLRKTLLIYQRFNKGIKGEEMSIFNTGITTCKTRNN